MVRAALVCRLWRRLVSAAAFSRRFHEFHRAAPLLGVLCKGQDDSDENSFVPASSFRHGRVLLFRLREPSGPGLGPWTIGLSVWDPITDEQQHLPGLPSHSEWKAAVVCAAAGGVGGGCDHLDCHRGSFPVLVLFMAFKPQRMFTCIYASEASAWSEPTSTNHPYIFSYFEPGPGFLLGNTLYFLLRHCSGILKTIDLEKLLPVDALKSSVRVNGFADGARVLLMYTFDGLYSIDVKSEQVRKVPEFYAYEYAVP
ncbi:hypothetical protein C2845_PM04G01320 [Panicum miliaceum]|uniref:F-box domain-containing protein n=1 Tax=Panicum miliaceum TaxID=4540 RepID=A0A3L6QMQ6_PANMI|nr:hypothetical protein C2845_PM04G01320 [Panicum miliaceum]